MSEEGQWRHMSEGGKNTCLKEGGCVPEGGKVHVQRRSTRGGGHDKQVNRGQCVTLHVEVKDVDMLLSHNT